ncbi:biliverdin-producing heme oxygenase [Sphingomonas sp. CJ20]
MTPSRKALREATAAAHDRVDAAFGAFDLGDRAGYAAFLRAHADAIGPIEAALDAGDAARLFPDWPERRRAGLLAEDLAMLGHRATPAPAPLPPLSDPAAIAGTLYVLEGSRLGGRFLARQLPADFPRAYLNADQRAEKWTQLLEHIEKLLQDASALEAARFAALAAFSRFERSAQEWRAKG